MTALILLHRTVILILFVKLLFAATAPSAVACSRTTDCMIGDRSYRIALPEGHDGVKRIGAIIFVHGYRGTAAEIMLDKNFITLASDLDVAFVAAQAAGPEWNIPNIPSVDALGKIDELSYFDALSEDIISRFPIDKSKLIVAGHSSGAMLVWHLACYRGSSFAAFVPVGGTFWRPMPTTCPTGPVNLIHYHGDNDPIVPLHGRPIKDAHQGDVYEAIALISGLGNYEKVSTDQSPELDCVRQKDRLNHIIELCLFPGGHELKAEHLSRAARIFAVFDAHR